MQIYLPETMPDETKNAIPVMELFERAVACGRISHAYLFTCEDLSPLEQVAMLFSRMILCESPTKDPSCNCKHCELVSKLEHPDIHIIRPKSKLRMILIPQIRDLMREIHLKPVAGHYKIGIIVGADRMNADAANAFLKTLEEPPPRSVLLLLSTDPHRLLETVRSRCLHVPIAFEAKATINPELKSWLYEVTKQLISTPPDIVTKYKVLGLILAKLQQMRNQIETQLTKESPLEIYATQDLPEETREKWKEELAAQIEAEYRHARSELMKALTQYFRDVWLLTMGMDKKLLYYPDLQTTMEVAQRLNPKQAVSNIQILHRAHKILFTNVQELLVLESAILQLHL